IACFREKPEARLPSLPGSVVASFHVAGGSVDFPANVLVQRRIDRRLDDSRQDIRVLQMQGSRESRSHRGCRTSYDEVPFAFAMSERGVSSLKKKASLFLQRLRSQINNHSGAGEICC